MTTTDDLTLDDTKVDPYAPDERALLDSLEAKHGEVWVVRFAGQMLVHRCPNPPEYKRALKDSDKDSITALEWLSDRVVVHPSADDWKTLKARRPGVVNTVGNSALKVANDQLGDRTAKYEALTPKP